MRAEKRAVAGNSVLAAIAITALKIVVGVSGASGAIYGLRLLERLHLFAEVETHLILTRSGEKTLFLETGKKSADRYGDGNNVWYPKDMPAPLLKQPQSEMFRDLLHLILADRDASYCAGT